MPACSGARFKCYGRLVDGGPSFCSAGGQCFAGSIQSAVTLPVIARSVPGKTAPPPTAPINLADHLCEIPRLSAGDGATLAPNSPKEGGRDAL